MVNYYFSQPENSFWSKLRQISLPFLFVIMLISSIGIFMLYSAANGEWEPWASTQLLHLGLGVIAFFLVSLVSAEFWYRYAYVFYGIALALVIAVELKGYIGMGAQRWIKIGFLSIQPSELMKVGLVLALARYYHNIHVYQARYFSTLFVPLSLAFLPVAFVMRQPDLGTALIIVFVAVTLIFLSGAAKRLFVGAFLMVIALIPLAWHFLHPYQKQRVLTFLDPERDPLGAGYHIIQSKIALGSGGLSGKGFLEGSQAHLNFLPEKQTDFIFTMLCEEYGFIGGASVVFLFLLVIAYGYKVGFVAKSQFSRLLALGMITSFFCYIFINMGMVMGLLPVVGKPLPLLSYGGASLVTTFISLGFIMNARIHDKSMS
jgi:rod shape determining protein RodA